MSFPLLDTAEQKKGTIIGLGIFVRNAPSALGPIMDTIVKGTDRSRPRREDLPEIRGSLKVQRMVRYNKAQECKAASRWQGYKSLQG